MRTLLFNASGQNLAKSPDCDFAGIVSGSKGYLQAAFSFSADWRGCAKAAVFWNYSDQKYYTPIIQGKCMVPDEVTDRSFYLSIVGQKEGYRLTTNKAEVSVEWH